MKTIKNHWLALTGIVVVAGIFVATILNAFAQQLDINPPTFPTTNTVQLTLSGTQTNTLLYNIQYTPDLGNIPFSTVVTGMVGQIVFTLTNTGSNANFFRAFGTNVSTPLIVATPAFSPGGGTYSTAQIVTITCATPLSTIYCTTNGSTPTTSDIFIASGGTVTLSSMVTLKAKAFRSGYTDSGVASAAYLINSPPVVNAGPQQVNSSTSATLQGYVTDDGLPTGSSLTNTWSKVSGPGTVTFGNLHQTNSSATFGANGIYVLQLTGTDGQYTTTNTVTIAVNTSLSVSLTAPGGGSTFTVPTNFTFEATAACTSGSLTNVGFYANGTLVGTATNAPFTFNWQSVTAGTLVLTAVAKTTDANNTGLASSPVTVTVNWPTNVGQVTMSSTDLQIPVAGLPIAINRLYNTQFGGSGSFGYNGKLDYEQINVQTSGALATDWSGKRSGLTYSIVESTPHLITVSLSPGEQYYFVPTIVFDSTGTSSINASQEPTCYNFYTVHFVCASVGQGQLSVAAPPDTVGMDDSLTGWTTTPLVAVHFDDIGFPINNYEPASSDFTFTAPDGTTYNFDGSGNVTQHTDRNGNYLQYGSGGIVHSTGLQVTFTRDGNNRITQIFDPIALATSGSPAVTYGYDGNGNLTNVGRLVNRTGPTYVTTSYAYTNTSFPNNVTSVIDPRGVTTQRYEYDTSGRLNKQYDAFNRYTIYTYDSVGHRQIVVDRLSNTTVQNFTPSGQLASIQDAQGEVTQYGYDSQGRLIAQTNAAGQVTTYAYDGNNQLIGITNELQQSSSTTYNQYGQALVAIDNLGNGTTNAYDANGNLLAVTNALSVVTRYGYDAQGNVTAQTNAFGTGIQTATLNQYDAFGNLTNSVDTLVNATSYTYDANDNRQTQSRKRTTVSGQQTLLTTFVYDAANRIIQTIDPDGLTNVTVYNSISKQSQTIDKLQRTNSFTYDAAGQLTNATSADGLYESYAYDAEGRKTNSVDRAGNPTSFSYDNVGRLYLTTYADDTASGTVYDAAGRATSAIQYPINPVLPGLPAANPLTTLYGYDAAGRRTALTNALNQVTRFAYDANGNQTNQVDTLLHTNTYAYDALGHQTQVLYADSTSDSSGFDALERRIAATNQAGIVTRFGYDALGRLTSVTNAFGTTQQAITRYAYDEVGNQTNQVDALNRTNKFEYDAMGRRTKQILPGLQAATFGYDKVGNQIRITNFNNAIITNQYDALNRMTNKASSGGYTIGFELFPTGQRATMFDASGTTTYTYDTCNRLLTKATPQGTLTYTYDALGNMFKLRSSTTSGTSLKYFRDNLNRITNVVDRFANSTFYGFDAAGNLQNSLYPNNVTNAYAYDALNRLTNISVKTASGTIASFGYRLGLAGNRTNLAENVTGTARTNAWGYDPLYRLTNEVITGGAPTGTIGYSYDIVGNRTNRTSTVSGISAATPAYGTNDTVTGDTYDNNGSTTASGGTNYGYDVESHLTNFNSGAVTFVYDGDGTRVKKTAGGVATYYLVDDHNPSGYPQVLEELATVGSTPAVLYTYGLDLISQRQANATTSFYGYDGNGNTRFLTGTNAAISDTYAYDSFGTLIASTGTTTNNYRFTGEQYDPNLGFYYLRSRYLNPGTGRFWTRDAYEGYREVPASLHKYAYCQLNPVNRTDPSGNASTVSAQIGVAVHQYIGRDFSDRVAGGVSGPSVVKILEGLPGFSLPPSLQGVVTALFPDLTDTLGKQVYEIKPDNVSSIALGEAQLQAYIDLFNYLDPRGGWHRGTSYSPPLTVTVNALNYAVAVGSPVTPPGMILYKVFSVQQIVRKKAVQTAVAENADVEDSVGISTLISSLGGF